MSLSDGLDVAKRAAIELYHIRHIDNHSIVEIPALKHPDMKVFKLKKFACKALKEQGVQSVIRLIYSFNATKKELLFLDIYYKGDRENEDSRYLRLLIKEL